MKRIDGFESNVLLKNLTTYKIGGFAKYFFIAKNKEDLIWAIKTAKEFKLPVLVLGGGSNLLISDKGFNGLAIKISIDNFEIKNRKVLTGAGTSLQKLVHFTAENGMSGLEWAGGIPGATVGGSIFGHAQAFGVKISDVVESVQVLDLKTLKIKNFSKKQCQFSLKNSIFKKNKNLIIISSILGLRLEDRDVVKNKVKEYLNYRKARHPVLPSAGSTFVNPEKKITNKKLLEKFPELIEFNKKGIIPSGYLIEKVGLQGKKIGGAQISEKHANFIVNTGDAKAKDVVALIKLAKQKVKKIFNINLETEVQFVNIKK